MHITYYKIENKLLVSTDQDIKAEDWNKEIDWVDCRTDTPKKFTNLLNTYNLYDGIADYIEHPEAHPFSNSVGETLIINIAISNADDIYQTDYISVLLNEKVIITVAPPKSDLFNERNIASFSGDKYPSIRYFLFNLLAVKILAQSNVNMSIARIRLQGVEHLLATEPEELSSNDLMTCEREISQLSDIIEDQYVGFEILVSLGSSKTKKESMQQARDTIKGFAPLDKAMLRLEKKAESLRLQYMLIQQEKSTRKINVLTIIQAIFVPLTFIAGVYGMNFLNMPELEWKYGYLLVWGVFIVMAGGLLSYFYRKGWFN